MLNDHWVYSVSTPGKQSEKQSHHRWVTHITELIFTEDSLEGQCLQHIPFEMADDRAFQSHNHEHEFSFWEGTLSPLPYSNWLSDLESNTHGRIAMNSEKKNRTIFVLNSLPDETPLKHPWKKTISLYQRYSQTFKLRVNYSNQQRLFDSSIYQKRRKVIGLQSDLESGKSGNQNLVTKSIWLTWKW